MIGQPRAGGRAPEAPCFSAADTAPAIGRRSSYCLVWVHLLSRMGPFIVRGPFILSYGSIYCLVWVHSLSRMGPFIVGGPFILPYGFIYCLAWAHSLS